MSETDRLHRPGRDGHAHGPQPACAGPLAVVHNRGPSRSTSSRPRAPRAPAARARSPSAPTRSSRCCPTRRCRGRRWGRRPARRRVGRRPAHRHEHDRARVAIAVALAGAERGVGALDAPVSGGDVGARRARCRSWSAATRPTSSARCRCSRRWARPSCTSATRRRAGRQGLQPDRGRDHYRGGQRGAGARREGRRRPGGSSTCSPAASPPTA